MNKRKLIKMISEHDKEYRDSEVVGVRITERDYLYKSYKDLRGTSIKIELADTRLTVMVIHEEDNFKFRIDYRLRDIYQYVKDNLGSYTDTKDDEGFVINKLFGMLGVRFLNSNPRTKNIVYVVNRLTGLGMFYKHTKLTNIRY